MSIDESPDEARTWDALAGRYETIVRLFDRSYPAIRERLERELRGQARVLEIAAGTGQFTLTIAHSAREVVATDISAQMIRRLAAAVQAEGLTNVKVEVMSSYGIEAKDGVFDAVVCANALHVMDHPEQALREFRRVLRERGLLVAPTFLHGVDKIRLALSRSLSLVSPFVAHTRFDLQGLRSLLERSGFDVARAERLPGLFPIGYVVAHSASSEGCPAQ